MSDLEAAMLRYDDRRVIVTGASSGMGAATAALIARLGGGVHGLDIEPVEGPVHAAYRCDVSDASAIDDVVNQIGSPVPRW